MPGMTKEIVIPLPPLTEQHRISEEVERCLSIAYEFETYIISNLKRAERLRQSILQDAFAGRLVSQDPNDEPASVLIERIDVKRQFPRLITNNHYHKAKQVSGYAESFLIGDSSMNTASCFEVWGFCNTLRDDGVGYGDYLEQLTYLIFLKMADEYAKPPYNRHIEIPEQYNWQSLISKRGAELEVHYVTLLLELGKKKGLLGQIFTKAQNKIQDPAKLYRVIDMIDSTDWLIMGADIKGDIYEGLLEKNAEDTKSGAGQYFTPRALIKAMVHCVRPEPGKTIADPACGTGGFFLATYDFLVANYQLDKYQKSFLKHDTFWGNEIVANTRRLCLMNMFLHNIGEIDGEFPFHPMICWLRQ